jgi:hypothetical protein
MEKDDEHLIARKAWHDEQISLYDCNNTLPEGKYVVYYEQDKKDCQGFDHMVVMNFKNLETATSVYEALRDNLVIIMSPSTKSKGVVK